MSNKGFFFAIVANWNLNTEVREYGTFVLVLEVEVFVTNVQYSAFGLKLRKTHQINTLGQYYPIISWLGAERVEWGNLDWQC